LPGQQRKRMKTELEAEDIDVIADKVFERLKLIIDNNSKYEAEDTIFDVQGLAQYLKVGKQWVYEKVHQGSIPYYKVGKYPRFRKSKIDDWLKKKEKGYSIKPANSVRRLLEDAA
jgi:excisionase family DNA binding protein